ncbi:MAG: hypothetical protein DWB59_13010 [Anaerolineae bacterium]|nr:hypothetical protein [Anaerolineae bacterium]
MNDAAAQSIAALQAIINGTTAANKDNLPRIVTFNAGQMFAAQIQVVRFANGSCPFPIPCWQLTNSPKPSRLRAASPSPATTIPTPSRPTITTRHPCSTPPRPTVFNPR